MVLHLKYLEWNTGTAKILLLQWDGEIFLGIFCAILTKYKHPNILAIVLATIDQYTDNIQSIKH